MIRELFKHTRFLVRKPLVLPGVLSGCARTMLLRKTVLRTVDLAVTGECHYKCAFCSAQKMYQSGGPYLSVGQIRSVWKQCMALGAVHLNLTGGEPFLRDIGELAAIIAGADPRRHLISLVTNGLHATAENIAILRRAGLDTLQLSIESVDPGVHDALAGIPGSHAKAMEAMRCARGLGMNVCLNVVFFNDNTEEIRRLMEFCRKERVFLVLNTASAEGRWQDVGNRRLNRNLAEVFDRLLDEDCVRHDSSANFSGRRECPAGKERIHITAYGDVLTCPLVQVSYGNVCREPVARIHERMRGFAHLSRYSRVCKHAFDVSYQEQILAPLKYFSERPVTFPYHPIQGGNP